MTTAVIVGIFRRKALPYTDLAFEEIWDNIASGHAVEAGGRVTRFCDTCSEYWYKAIRNRVKRAVKKQDTNKEQG